MNPKKPTTPFLKKPIIITVADQIRASHHSTITSTDAERNKRQKANNMDRFARYNARRIAAGLMPFNYTEQSNRIYGTPAAVQKPKLTLVA